MPRPPFVVLALLTLVIVACGCGATGSRATPSSSAPSTPTIPTSPSRQRVVLRVTRTALRHCLARQARVSEQPERILAVFGANYIKAWVYSSPARARRVYNQARGYGIVPAALMGTSGTIFFQWKRHPSVGELKLFGRCLRLALTAAHLAGV
jgi:hypothetical protein